MGRQFVARVDGLARRYSVVGAYLSHPTDGVAHQVESRYRINLIAGGRMRDRPGRYRQELATLGGDREGKPLPDRLCDEWHDGMEQPEGKIEHVREDGTRDFAIASLCADTPLGCLEIPIGELVPDEVSSCLGVLAQANASEPHVLLPLSPRRSPRAQDGVPPDDSSGQ